MAGKRKEIHKELNAALRIHHCFLSLASNFLEETSFCMCVQTEHVFKPLQGVMLLTKEPVAAFKTTSNRITALRHLNKNSFLLKLNSIYPNLKEKNNNSATIGSLAGPVCATYSLVIVVM